MNQEFLKNRLELLNKQLEQTMANYNALHGAKQECEYLLSQINAQEKACEPDQPCQQENPAGLA